MLEPHLFDSQCDLAALVYEPDQDPDAMLRAFAADLNFRGYRLAGLIQRGHRVTDAPELPAVLVHSGENVNLFRDLDARAGGRRLDLETLIRVGDEIAAAIDRGTDLLLLNRFGRQEREGNGLLNLIDRALGADVPVLVAVPSFCFADWIRFSNGMSIKIANSRQALHAWWDAVSVPVEGIPRSGRARFCETFK